MSDEPYRSIVGALIDPGVIEESIEAQLRARLPWYLREIERQQGRREGSLGTPNSYGVSTDYERFPEQGLPAIIIAAPGLREVPTKDGDGYLSGIYAAEVSATLPGPAGEGKGRVARRAAQIWGIAIAAALLQRRSLGDQAKCTDLIDQGFVDVAYKPRAIVSVVNVFTVELENFLNIFDGPTGEDLPDPVPEDWPEITDVDVDVVPGS